MIMKILITVATLVVFFLYYTSVYHPLVFNRVTGGLRGYFGFVFTFFRFHVLKHFRENLPLESKKMFGERQKAIETAKITASRLEMIWLKWEASLVEAIMNSNNYYKYKKTGKHKNKLRLRFWRFGRKKMYVKIKPEKTNK